MIDIKKLKQAALAANKPESFTVDEVIEFTDLSMPSAVLELITRLEAAESNQILGASASQFKEMEARLEAAELEFKQYSQLLDDAHRSLEAAESERDTHRDERKLLSEAFAEQLTKLTAAEQDAARYRWLNTTLHSAKGGASVCVNDEFSYYEIPEEGKEVRIQWYPDTPVGFYLSEASTLSEAIDEAMKESK